MLNRRAKVETGHFCKNHVAVLSCELVVNAYKVSSSQSWLLQHVSYGRMIISARPLGRSRPRFLLPPEGASPWHWIEGEGKPENPIDEPDHIPTEDLERHYLGRSTQVEAGSIETHLSRCLECVDRFEAVKRFMKLARSGAFLLPRVRQDG
jgi:hypothetical protein